MEAAEADPQAVIPAAPEAQAGTVPAVTAVPADPEAPAATALIIEATAPRDVIILEGHTVTARARSIMVAVMPPEGIIHPVRLYIITEAAIIRPDDLVDVCQPLLPCALSYCSCFHFSGIL